MKSVIVESIPLSRAVLCEDCRMITAATNQHCQVCGSQAVVNIETLLAPVPKMKRYKPISDDHFYKPIERSM